MGIDEEIKQKEKELEDLIAQKQAEINELLELKKMIDEPHSYIGYCDGQVYILSDIPDKLLVGLGEEHGQ